MWPSVRLYIDRIPWIKPDLCRNMAPHTLSSSSVIRPTILRDIAAMSWVIILHVQGYDGKARPMIIIRGSSDRGIAVNSTFHSIRHRPSGKSNKYLPMLGMAYFDLTAILSKTKSKSAKLEYATWLKSTRLMNLTYLGLSSGLCSGLFLEHKSKSVSNQNFRQASI